MATLKSHLSKKYPGWVLKTPKERYMVTELVSELQDCIKAAVSEADSAKIRSLLISQSSAVLTVALVAFFDGWKGQTAIRVKVRNLGPFGLWGAGAYDSSYQHWADMIGKENELDQIAPIVMKQMAEVLATNIHCEDANGVTVEVRVVPGNWLADNKGRGLQHGTYGGTSPYREICRRYSLMSILRPRPCFFLQSGLPCSMPSASWNDTHS